MEAKESETIHTKKIIQGQIFCQEVLLCSAAHFVDRCSLTMHVSVGSVAAHQLPLLMHPRLSVTHRRALFQKGSRGGRGTATPRLPARPAVFPRRGKPTRRRTGAGSAGDAADERLPVVQGTPQMSGAPAASAVSSSAAPPAPSLSGPPPAPQSGAPMAPPAAPAKPVPVGSPHPPQELPHHERQGQQLSGKLHVPRSGGSAPARVLGSAHKGLLIALAGLMVIAAGGITLALIHKGGGGTPPRPGTITSFSLPTAASHPEGITKGPDGNLWFTEYNGNQIGRITPGGTITEFPFLMPLAALVASQLARMATSGSLRTVGTRSGASPRQAPSLSSPFPQSSILTASRRVRMAISGSPSSMEKRSGGSEPGEREEPREGGKGLSMVLFCRKVCITEMGKTCLPCITP